MWKATLTDVTVNGAHVQFTNGVDVRDEIYPLSEFNTKLQFRDFIKKIVDSLNAEVTKATTFRTTLSQYIGKEIV